MWLQVLIGLWGVFLCGPSLAGNQLAVDHTTGFMSISDYVDIARAPSSSSFNDVSQLSFQAGSLSSIYEKDVTQLGDTFWLRLVVLNSSQVPLTLFFGVDNPHLHQVRFYYPAKGKYFRKVVGLQHRVATRPHDLALPHFKVRFRPREVKQLYIKVSGSRGLMAPVFLASQETMVSLVKERKLYRLVYWLPLFLAAILFMMAWNQGNMQLATFSLALVCASGIAVYQTGLIFELFPNIKPRRLVAIEPFIITGFVSGILVFLASSVSVKMGRKILLLIVLALFLSGLAVVSAGFSDIVTQVFLVLVSLASALGSGFLLLTQRSLMLSLQGWGWTTIVSIFLGFTLWQTMETHPFRFLGVVGTVFIVHCFYVSIGAWKCFSLFSRRVRSWQQSMEGTSSGKFIPHVDQSPPESKSDAEKMNHSS